MDRYLVKDLKKHLLSFEAKKVGADGILSNYKGGDVGSLRRSFYSEEMAKTLFDRIKPLLPFIRSQQESFSPDAVSCPFWEAVGVNPLFRSIEYAAGGFLIPHYDAPVNFKENLVTLMSAVFYLDDVNQSGRTRFLKGHDPEFKDHTKKASEEDVKENVVAQAGDLLLFDHRLLHDGEDVKDSKHIIRTDIIFEGRGNGLI